jgi:lipopolysaccharide/colanic/teichoic acid biosynthesis glycosyltransferase
MLLTASLLAVRLRDALDTLNLNATFDPSGYGPVAAVVIPGLLLIFWLRGAYAREILFSGPEELARVVSGCTYGVLLVVAASFLNGQGPMVSRGWLLLFWTGAILLVGASRLVLRRIASRQRQQGRFIQRVLIAGASDQGLALAQQIHGPVERGIDVVGFLDDYLPPGTPLAPGERSELAEHLTVLGHPREAAAVVERTGCDLLIIMPLALTWESQQAMLQLGISSSGPIDVRVVPTQYDISSDGLDRRRGDRGGERRAPRDGKPAAERRRARPRDFAWSTRPAPLGYVPLLQVEPARILGQQAHVRAVVDVSIALILMIVLAPLALLAVVGARLRGVKQILVSERIMGQHARPVTLSLFNREVTNRLILRGWPAMIGVVRGDLSLVGPRPMRIEEAEQQREWAQRLLRVKPGLTGPWRLAHPAASVEDLFLADIWWIRNWSVWQHLFVLIRCARGAIISTMPTGQPLTRWEDRQSWVPLLADAAVPRSS